MHNYPLTPNILILSTSKIIFKKNKISQNLVCLHFPMGYDGGNVEDQTGLFVPICLTLNSSHQYLKSYS